MPSSSIILTFLQLNLLTLLILVLHSLSSAIGRTAFFVAVGLILCFSQFVGAAELSLSLGSEFSVNIADAVISSTFLTALLVTYALDGIIPAQRLTVAAFFSSAAFYLLAASVKAQALWPGFSTDAQTAPAFVLILDPALSTIPASLAAMLTDLLVLPVIFQILRNRHYSTFLCVTLSLIMTQVADTWVYSIVANYGSHSFWASMNHLFAARVLIGLWVGLIITGFLKLNHFSLMGKEKNPMQFLRSLVTSYSSSRLNEDTLAELEERFRLFVENTRDHILLLGVGGDIIEANSIFVERFQIADDLPSHQIGDFLVEANTTDKPPRHLEDIPLRAPSISALVRECLRSDSGAVLCELLLRSRSGDYISIEFNCSLLTSGNQPLLLLFGRETTLKNHLEFQHLLLMDEVSHLQRLESVGRLAGGVAHDFNNLLHSMQASADAIATASPARQAEHLQRLHAAMDRAARLTSNLLGFARKGAYQPVNADLREIVRSAIALFEPSARQQIQIQPLIGPDPLMIHADVTQIEQVLLNLLINARDALEGCAQPRITLRAELALPAMPGFDKAPTAAESKDFVVLRIRDNGSGIPPEILNKIFEPFFTTKPTGKGTGMGLAMAFGCISAHKGSIHVESTPGAGTEFFVYLPRINNQS